MPHTLGKSHSRLAAHALAAYRSGTSDANMQRLRDANQRHSDWKPYRLASHPKHAMGETMTIKPNMADPPRMTTIPNPTIRSSRVIHSTPSENRSPKLSIQHGTGVPPLDLMHSALDRAAPFTLNPGRPLVASRSPHVPDDAADHQSPCHYPIPPIRTPLEAIRLQEQTLLLAMRLVCPV